MRGQILLSVFTALTIFLTPSGSCAPIGARAIINDFIIQDTNWDWLVDGASILNNAYDTNVPCATFKDNTHPSVSPGHTLLAQLWDNVVRGPMHQTTLTPQLSLVISGTNATLSWPQMDPPFVLEWSPSLVVSNSWETVSAATVTNCNTLSVVVTLSIGDRFFRLQRQ